MKTHRTTPTLTIAALATMCLSACGESPKQTSLEKPAAPPARVIPGPSATPVRSPDRWQATLTTSKGDVVIDVTRAWAPRAADRFYELMTIGYFDGTRFFRMKPGFIVQWGIHGDTLVSAQWNDATFPDEPMRTTNARGTVAFAANGLNSRASQVFISTGENSKALDQQRVFAPFGKVVSGMDAVEQLYADYGEEPNFSKIVRQGNSYLRRWFPALDSIVSTRVDTTKR